MTNKIICILSSISSIISTVIFIRFFPPQWLGSVELIKLIQKDATAGESYIVFLFWFITLFLTCCLLLLNRKNSRKKVYIIIAVSILIEIILIPLAADFEIIGNIYIIYTTIVNLSLCIASLAQFDLSK